MQRTCLIVKLGAIGDVAMVLPAAWRLHEQGYAIDWMCGRSVAELLACYPWVRTIVVEDKKLFGGNRVAAMGEMLRVWRHMFGARYDLCAVLAYDWRYRLLTLPVRAVRRVSLSWRERRFSLVSERHHTAEYARILCDRKDDFCAENLAPVRPDLLPQNPLSRGVNKRIALVPGGARNLVRNDPQRRWPLDAYVALAKMLLARGYEVVLTGGPDDRWAAEAFVDLSVVDAIGRWKLSETLAAYDACDCVVTHDTGPMHLAGLTNCAMVALFGPTPPGKFLPRRDGVIALWGGERLSCRPCYDGREFANCAQNVCMDEIRPERVMDAVEHLLRAPRMPWTVESCSLVQIATREAVPEWERV